MKDDLPEACRRALDEALAAGGTVAATDAAILALLLEYTLTLPTGRSGCVVIAADRRLLRAADTEGLKTIDPEALAAASVPAFLAGLSSGVRDSRYSAPSPHPMPFSSGASAPESAARPRAVR